MAKRSRSKKTSTSTSTSASTAPVSARAAVVAASAPSVPALVKEAETGPAGAVSNVVDFHERRPKPAEEDRRAHMVGFVAAYMVQSMGLDEAAAETMAGELDADTLNNLFAEAQAAGDGGGPNPDPSSLLAKPTGAPEGVGVSVQPKPRSRSQGPPDPFPNSQVPMIETLADAVAVDEFRQIVQDRQFWAQRRDEAQSKLDDLNADVMMRLTTMSTKSVRIDQYRITGYFGVNVQISKTRLVEKGVDPAIIEEATVRSNNVNPTVQVFDLSKPESAKPESA